MYPNFTHPELDWSMQKKKKKTLPKKQNWFSRVYSSSPLIFFLMLFYMQADLPLLFLLSSAPANPHPHELCMTQLEVALLQLSRRALIGPHISRSGGDNSVLRKAPLLNAGSV